MLMNPFDEIAVTKHVRLREKGIVLEALAQVMTSTGPVAKDD